MIVMIGPFILLWLGVQSGLVAAWGYQGHEIIAILAQLHISSSAQEAINTILPDYVHGELSVIASWADQVKRRPEYRFSSSLHYVNPDNEKGSSTGKVKSRRSSNYDSCSWLLSPRDSCVQAVPTADEGCSDGGYGHNVVGAIYNYSTQLSNYRQDALSDQVIYNVDSKHHLQDALSFLVHFVGDLHQPLHLTGWLRGGNGQPVIYEGHRTNLHYVWDSQILQTTIRSLGSHTSPLPGADKPGTKANRLEKLLRGKIYDPYVRYLVDRRIGSNTSLGMPEACPASMLESVASHAHAPALVSLCPSYWASRIYPDLCVYVKNYSQPSAHLEVPGRAAQLPLDRQNNIPDLDDTYTDKIRDAHLMDQLLVTASLRLAHLLNALFV